MGVGKNGGVRQHNKTIEKIEIINKRVRERRKGGCKEVEVSE